MRRMADKKANQVHQKYNANRPLIFERYVVSSQRIETAEQQNEVICSDHRRVFCFYEKRQLTVTDLGISDPSHGPSLPP